MKAGERLAVQQNNLDGLEVKLSHEELGERLFALMVQQDLSPMVPVEIQILPIRCQKKQT